jgi:hypothetical protein
MVQPGHRRDGDDSAKIARLDRTSDRAIFFEREMRSGTLVVVDVRGHYATQVALVEDNYVVETFAANRTDDPLDVSVGSSCRMQLVRLMRSDPRFGLLIHFIRCGATPSAS